MENEIFGYSWAEIQKLQQKQAVDRSVNINATKDYGCDPIGNGMFKMVPSGDIVDFEERNKRLKRD